jgi:hypothetical protein
VDSSIVLASRRAPSATYSRCAGRVVIPLQPDLAFFVDSNASNQIGRIIAADYDAIVDWIDKRHSERKVEALAASNWQLEENILYFVGN